MPHRHAALAFVHSTIPPLGVWTSKYHALPPSLRQPLRIRSGHAGGRWGPVAFTWLHISRRPGSWLSGIIVHDCVQYNGVKMPASRQMQSPSFLLRTRGALKSGVSISACMMVYPTKGAAIQQRLKKRRNRYERLMKTE